MNKCLIVVPLWPALLVLKLQISLIDYTLSVYSSLISSQQVTLYNIDLTNLGMTWSLLCAKCTIKTQTTSQPMKYMNRYQCARTQCYEHHFYWLASWLRLQQQSHSKTIIPDFWHCQNFIASLIETLWQWPLLNLTVTVRHSTTVQSHRHFSHDAYLLSGTVEKSHSCPASLSDAVCDSDVLSHIWAEHRWTALPSAACVCLLILGCC